MKRFCSKECKEMDGVCDFCQYYDFNGDEDGVYVDKGFCKLHKKPSEPHWICDNFTCFLIKNHLTLLTGTVLPVNNETAY